MPCWLSWVSPDWRLVVDRPSSATFDTYEEVEYRFYQNLAGVFGRGVAVKADTASVEVVEHAAVRERAGSDARPTAFVIARVGCNRGALRRR
jgi:hypothetical protein